MSETKSKFSTPAFGIFSAIVATLWQVERVIGLAGLPEDLGRWTYVVSWTPYIGTAGMTLLGVYIWSIWDEQIKAVLTKLFPFILIGAVFLATWVFQPLIVEDPMDFQWSHPEHSDDISGRQMFECLIVGLDMYDSEPARHRFVEDCFEQRGFVRGDRR